MKKRENLKRKQSSNKVKYCFAENRKAQSKIQDKQIT